MEEYGKVLRMLSSWSRILPPPKLGSTAHSSVLKAPFFPITQQLSRGCSTQPLAAPAQQNLVVVPDKIIPWRCCSQAGGRIGRGQAGQRDTAGLVP